MLHKQPTVSCRNFKDLRITGVLLFEFELRKGRAISERKKKLLSNCMSRRRGFLDKTETVAKYKMTQTSMFNTWSYIHLVTVYKLDNTRGKTQRNDFGFILNGLQAGEFAWFLARLRLTTRYSLCRSVNCVSSKSINFRARLFTSSDRSFIFGTIRSFSYDSNNRQK